MMNEKNIEKIIRGFIAKEMAIEPSCIKPETNLVNDLNADSMSVVNVVTAIESRFKITFPSESEINYSGYTLQFLVNGVVLALQEKTPHGRSEV